MSKHKQVRGLALQRLAEPREEVQIDAVRGPRNHTTELRDRAPYAALAEAPNDPGAGEAFAPHYRTQTPLNDHAVRVA